MICLSLERGFTAVNSGPGECSVEVCVVSWPVCVRFPSVDLVVPFVESWGFCCLQGDGLFHTFVEAAMVVGCACISKLLTSPSHAGWRMRGELNIKIKKKNLVACYPLYDDQVAIHHFPNKMMLVFNMSGTPMKCLCFGQFDSCFVVDKHYSQDIRLCYFFESLLKPPYILR